VGFSGLAGAVKRQRISMNYPAEYLASDLAKTLPYFPQILCIFPGDISSGCYVAQEEK